MRLLSLIFLLLTLTGQAQEWQVLEPSWPVVGTPGEEVLVRVTGPSGRAPKLLHSAAAEPLSLKETSAGLYQAVIVLPESTASSEIILSELSSGLNRRLGELRTTRRSQSFRAREETVTRQGPNPAYDRLTPLYEGQLVTVDGRRGGWYRCVESGTWVDGRNSEEPGAGALVPTRLNRIVVSESPEGDALLTLEMDRVPEVQAHHNPATGTLQFTLYDTYQTNFDIKRPTQVAPFLGPIILRPIPSPRAVILELSASQFQGYQVLPDPSGSQLILQIRKPLPTSLQGLKITVDAGHGGERDKGTVGHGGLAEKTLNLRVAKALADRLRELGAEVVMTRTTDTATSFEEATAGEELQSRIDQSVEEGSQLFLSVHHNARPSVEEGKKAHGTDIYWYQPQSQALAKALADPVADAVDEELRSFRWRSFYVIRQTHAPAVLLEFQYLSNPQWEQILSQPDYPNRAAAGVVEGLREYLTTHQE